jgi:hypothetical protein
MNENQRPWTSEETITVFAAVEQCRATGGRLDWRAIAATVPGRSEQAAQAQYYKSIRVPAAPVSLPPSVLKSICVPAAPVVPPSSVLRRPCLRCRRPFDSLDRKRNWLCSSCNGQIAAIAA